jgi:phosphinothricin acetyltransferase
VGEALVVRSATAADAPAIQAIYAPVVLRSAVSFEETPPGVAEVVARMHAEPRLPWLVATRADVVVGYAYASRHHARAAYRWSVDCSIYLAEHERGRGTAGHLYRRLFAELSDLGYVSVFAGIALPNEASVGLHEALGFVPIGVYRQVGFKLGRWHDVGWWQLRLTDPPGAPPEPLRWEPASRPGPGLPS